VAVSRGAEESNRRMLRVRDAMDRTYAQPLDIASLARIACLSPTHLIRTFRATFGETPHRYLQRRRVERSMFLLRETDRSITDICFDVGFMSLGTFSRTFREIVGETPSGYRRGHGPIVAPHCVQLAAMRPRESASEKAESSSFGEAALVAAP
jgi:transcriptional regulator GlxA family with amidase domain